MTANYRIPALISAASAAALLLGGCASSGTVASLGGRDSSSAPTSTASGSATSGDATATDSPTTSAATDPTTTSAPPTHATSASGSDVFAGLADQMSDPGCKQAVTALESMSKLQNDPAKAATQFPTMLTQMRDAAKKTQKAGAKDAINKLADDFQGLISGKAFDKAKFQSDAVTFGVDCSDI